MTRVVITGATGHVGSVLARKLRERGVRVSGVTRHADRLRALGHDIEVQEGAIEDEGFLAKAFEGADAVFAMIPPSFAEQDFRAYQRRVAGSLTRAIESARVPRVVTLSSVGADLERGNGPIAGLHELEQGLEKIPHLHALHLRPTSFMENELGAIGLIKAKGFMTGVFGPELPIARIATRDIALAAAEILAAPTFTGHSFRELLGPRDYTPSQTARILGAAIGRTHLRYVQSSPEQVRQGLMAAGLPADMAGLFVEMQEAFEAGRIRPLQGRTPQTTTPTTFEAFAREVFAPAFEPELTSA